MSKRWWAAPLLMPLTGCYTYENAVRTRAANDFNCAEEKVAVTDIGANGYRAKGCGQVATYVCTADGNASIPSCVRE